MFGKTPERHEGLKQSVTLDKMVSEACMCIRYAHKSHKVSC